MSQQNMWEIEQTYFEQGIQIICGVDEAGRGPLAGPVCAAAVILPANAQIPGLNDSKKLSDKKRSGSTVSFIVPRAVGNCDIYPVKVSEIEEFIKAEN